MPRNGSGIYSQPFPNVVPDTTIESAVYNGFTRDVETDLNAPRPVNAGGTGSSSAAGALTNLGAVAKIGDTMTGALQISPATGNASLSLNNTGAGSSSDIYGTKGGNGRWLMRLGNPAAESGGNSGSNFEIMRYSDANAVIDSALTIDRGSAAASFTGPVYGASFNCVGAAYGPTSIELGSTSVAGVAYIDFHSSGTAVDYDARILVSGPTATANLTIYAPTITFGSPLVVCAGNVNVVGDVICNSNSAASGVFRFGNNGSKYISCDSANYVFGSGGILVNGGIVTVGMNGTNYGYQCVKGINGAKSNAFNFFWNNAQMEAWVDSTYLGTLAYTSDYRIKKDVIDLPGMWDTVKALRPIQYTQAEFQPPSQKKFIAEETLKARKEAEENPQAKPREVNTGPLFVADDTERWGFVAHELQATLTESAATGVKDSPDTVQSPNPWTVIAALTKALQEAMARIEALEAA
jgi:hypothetical protein